MLFGKTLTLKHKRKKEAFQSGESSTNGEWVE